MSASPACSPRVGKFCFAVVSGPPPGTHSSRPSKPTIERSPGTEAPRSRRASMSMRATVSFTAKTAEEPFSSRATRRAAEPSDSPSSGAKASSRGLQSRVLQGTAVAFATVGDGRGGVEVADEGDSPVAEFHEVRRRRAGGADVLRAHEVGLEPLRRAAVDEHELDPPRPRLAQGGQVAGAAKVPKDRPVGPVVAQLADKPRLGLDVVVPTRVGRRADDEPRVRAPRRPLDAAHDGGGESVLRMGPKPNAEARGASTVTDRGRESDDGAATLGLEQQPLGGEGADGLADHGAADAVLVGEGPLAREGNARAQVAVGDLAAQRPRDDLG